MHLKFERKPKPLIRNRHTMRMPWKEDVILLSATPMPVLVATNLDLWVDETSIKLSYLLLTLRATDEYKIYRGEGSARLEFKYHFDTRRSYAVYTPLRKFISTDEHAKESIEKVLNRKIFINITQPLEQLCTRFDHHNLFYPEEVYKAFSEKLGFEASGKWFDLAWQVRLSYIPSLEMHKDIRTWFEFLNQYAKVRRIALVKSKMLKYIQEKTGGIEDPEAWEVDEKIDIPAMKFLKKKLSKGTDIGPEEQRHLMGEAVAICEVNVGKNFYSSYWRNPECLRHHKAFSQYFHDINILRYVIENVNIGKFYSLHQTREVFLAVWRTEPIMARRFIESPVLFDDVTRMVFDIRQSGFEFKTKGPLSVLHDLAIREHTRLKQANCPINPPHEDEIIGKGENQYLVHYPRSTHELIDVGITLSNCVGSYGTRAATGRTIIFTVYKDNVLKACCEVNRGHLAQAYGFGNSQLPRTLERIIREYHKQKEWPDYQYIPERNPPFVNNAIAEEIDW